MQKILFKNPIIIKASNQAGDYKYYSFDVTVYSWGIALDKGWNLISIPYMPTSSSIDDVFADIYDNIAYVDGSTATVLMYNAVEALPDDLSGAWYQARRQSLGSTKKFVLPTGGSNKLISIVPGHAYWIKMENADVLYGIEENFVIDSDPGQNGINLATESWNLIGRFGSDPIPLDWWKALKSRILFISYHLLFL